MNTAKMANREYSEMNTMKIDISKAIQTGILTYKRMVKKKDLVKVFYIYICLCHVCPAHPCGDNPLRQLVRISSSTGRDLQNVLITLRHINLNAYRQLRNEFQRYAACVGVVDTGYFKRSTDAFIPMLKKRLEKDPSLDDIIDLMSYDDVREKENENDRLSELRLVRDWIKNRLYSVSDIQGDRTR